MKKQPKQFLDISKIAVIDLENKEHVDAVYSTIGKLIGNLHPSLRIVMTGGTFIKGSGFKGKFEAFSSTGPSIREKQYEKRLKQDLEFHAVYLGIDVNKVGPNGERLVGFNSKGRKQPWIVTKKGDSQRYKVADELASRWFKKDAVAK